MMTPIAPQYTIDDLYVAPFTARRHFDPETGAAIYTPIERNARPTGIRLMDDFLEYIAADAFFSRKQFAARYGLTSDDLNTFVRVLTGLGAQEFLYAILFRLADDLLRYTSLPLATVARRCGANTQSNLNVLYDKCLHTTPLQRRRALRKRGDEDRYRV